MASSWIEALKIYNNSKHKKGDMWCVPKKGSEDHGTVLTINNIIKSRKNKKGSKVQIGIV